MDALRDIAHDAGLYHVNDEYSFRADAPVASGPERELLAWADVSYFTSRALLERKGPLARHAEFLPNGVDYAAFLVPGGSTANLSQVWPPGAIDSWIGPFGVAMVAVLWAYDGWIETTYVGGEIQDSVFLGLLARDWRGIRA